MLARFLNENEEIAEIKTTKGLKDLMKQGLSKLMWTSEFKRFSEKPLTEKDKDYKCSYVLSDGKFGYYVLSERNYFLVCYAIKINGKIINKVVFARWSYSGFFAPVTEKSRIDLESPQEARNLVIKLAKNNKIPLKYDLKI